MTHRKHKRHLSPAEIEQIARWIEGRTYIPTWREVSEFTFVTFRVRRTVEAIRRRESLADAMQRRRAASVTNRESDKKRAQERALVGLQEKCERLRSENERLEKELNIVLERNLRLTNAMAAQMIPDSLTEVMLPPINRDPTNKPRPRPTN